MVSEELKIVVRAEASNAVRELNQLQGATQKVSTNFTNIAKSLLGPIGVAAGVAMLTRKLSEGVRASITYAASMEKTGVAFEVMLGSARKAEDVLKDIEGFSKSTPFQFQNLADAAKRLIAFGTEAEDVVDVMRDLGNAAMGDQAILDRLTLAYGKLQAKGKASLEELNMFTEAGVPILKALQEQLGLTQESLFEYITAGKLGFEDVNKALQDLTRGEGQFAGMLERQSQTLEGAISTLKDNIIALGGALADDFLPYLTEIVKKITNIVDMVSKGMTYSQAYKEIGIRTFGGGISQDFATSFPGMGRQEIVEEALRRLSVAQAVQQGLGEELSARAEGRVGPVTEATFLKTDKQLRNLQDAAGDAAAALSTLLTRYGITLPGARGAAAPGSSGTVGGGAAGEAGGTFGAEAMNGLQWAMENSWFWNEDDIKKKGEEAGESYAQGFTKFLEWAASNPNSAFFQESDILRQASITDLTSMRFPQSGGISSPFLSKVSDEEWARMAGITSTQADLGGTSWISGSRLGGGVNFAEAIAGATFGGASGKEIETEKIKELLEEMGSMVASGVPDEIVNMFESIGAAMASGDSAAAMTATIKSITSMMKEIFLWGAKSAFGEGLTALGIVFLGLAGISAFAGGYFGATGTTGGRAPSSNVVRGSGRGGTVYGMGDNIQNPTGAITSGQVVIQNIQGSVWATDQLQGLAANAAQGLNSGR